MNILLACLNFLLFQQAELQDSDLCNSTALHWGVLVHHKQRELHHLLHRPDLFFCIFSFTMEVSEIILKSVAGFVLFLKK